jgi:hypothetical protein
MTLLELMLALSLSVFVLVAISMAIDLHLRVLQDRRNYVERIQLARAVLTIIANDLRATVQQNTTDFSALASMVSQAAVSEAALDTLASSGTGGSGTGTGGTGAGSGTGGSGTGAGSSSGGSGTSPGTSSTAGAGTSSGSTSGAATADTDTDSSETSESANIASSSAVPPVPGLYGNQYELQVDVSRLPRVDEFQRMTADTRETSLQDIPSDVKTVAYYCANANSATSSGVTNRRTGQFESGLVRRVMDRAVTLYASQYSSNSQGLMQAAEVIAPEVMSIEFQYYDGTEWLFEWDSAEKEGLPVAVKITVLLVPTAAVNAATGAVNQSYTASQIQPDQMYSLTVRLPTAKPVTSDTTTDSSGMDAVGL